MDHIHPGLSPLCNNFEAENTIFGKIHVTFYTGVSKGGILNEMRNEPKRPAEVVPLCIVSPLKYEARGPLPSEPFKRALYR